MGTVKQYPQVMKVASFYSTIGTIQSAILCLFLERDPNAWKLNLNSSELLLIVLTVREYLIETPKFCKLNPVFKVLDRLNIKIKMH